MDLSEVQQIESKGKRATVPKHGKRPENRLWSKTKRGDGKQKERDGINPDGVIDVACVTGSEVRTYRDVKAGRGLKSILNFSHRGAAIQYAHGYEESQRKSARV